MFIGCFATGWVSVILIRLQYYCKIIYKSYRELNTHDAADTEQLLRLIQSIPSPKAEPFKIWLASVGKDRINETADPELAIDRALVTYLRKGYSKDWIGQRLQAIQVRKELTNEWEERGVEGNEYTVLTDEITKAWAGLTTRQYKNLKGLTKENLRDNMSMLELTLNQLAEVTTTELSKEQKPQTFEENRQVAKSGGEVAGKARREIEKRTGKPAITSKNAIDFSRLLTDITNKENKPNTKKKKNNNLHTLSTFLTVNSYYFSNIFLTIHQPLHSNQKPTNRLLIQQNNHTTKQFTHQPTISSSRKQCLSTLKKQQIVKKYRYI